MQVGAQVGTAKTVNRLLGVADHHQRVAVVRFAVSVNPVQAVVLPRVGVLKFIDHGHRVMLANGRRQLTVIVMQSLVQALQQIVEIEHRLALLGLLVRLAHRLRGMRNQQRFAFGLSVGAVHQSAYQSKQSKVLGLVPTAGQQFVFGETLQGGRAYVVAVHSPSCELIHPFVEIRRADACGFDQARVSGAA